MKVIVISLKSSEKRRASVKNQLDRLNIPFEFLDAVEGKNLSGQDMERYCDMEIARKYPQWLNKGAIGCALSHKQAYEKILKDHIPMAFVIEDDMILPDDLQFILNGINEKIQENELSLLYYRTKRKILLTTQGQREFGKYKLLYPVDRDSIPVSACGYVITNAACLSLLPNIIPLKVSSDSWDYYYDLKGFQKISVVHPRPMKDGLFKSEIDYVGAYTNQLKSRLSKLINKHEVPILFQYLKKQRGKREEMMFEIEISDQPSIFN